MSKIRRKAKNEINAILSQYPTKRSAVLPLSYLAQQEYGHLSPEAVQEVAEILELDATEVQALIGFYALLHEEPAGEYVIEICNDLPCVLRGAEQFVDHVCQKLGVSVGETTEDDLFTVRTVMCVAACDKAPVAQINLEYYQNLDPEKFDDLVEQMKNEAEPAPPGE